MAYLNYLWTVTICCHRAIVFYSWRSDFQQAPSHRNGDSMSSVVRLQFVDQVLDVEIDRSFSNCELIGDLLISMAVTDEPEYLQLPVGEIVFAEMLREARCNFGRQIPATCGDCPDHLQQFVLRHALENVARRPGSHGSLDLSIAVGGGQHDNTCLRVFSANRNQCICTIRARKAEIHSR